MSAASIGSPRRRCAAYARSRSSSDRSASCSHQSAVRGRRAPRGPSSASAASKPSRALGQSPASRASRAVVSGASGDTTNPTPGRRSGNDDVVGCNDQTDPRRASRRRGERGPWTTPSPPRSSATGSWTSPRRAATRGSRAASRSGSTTSAGATTSPARRVPRAWYANLVAHPRFVLHLKESATAGPAGERPADHGRRGAARGLRRAAAEPPVRDEAGRVARALAARRGRAVRSLQDLTAPPREHGGMSALTSIPNVGPAIARKLERLGVARAGRPARPGRRRALRAPLRA